VKIGGRGKAGGIKVAQDEDEARAAADTILGMDIRGFTVHEVWVEEASEIAPSTTRRSSSTAAPSSR
jgi:succinyl-CoA synthetase beta subunit